MNDITTNQEYIDFIFYDEHLIYFTSDGFQSTEHWDIDPQEHLNTNTPHFTILGNNMYKYLLIITVIVSIAYNIINAQVEYTSSVQAHVTKTLEK